MRTVTGPSSPIVAPGSPCPLPLTWPVVATRKPIGPRDRAPHRLLVIPTFSLSLNFRCLNRHSKRPYSW